jgi:hypothetical protein
LRPVRIADGAWADVGEAKLRPDASLLEPPDGAESAIYVRPTDTVADVLAGIRPRLPERHLSA